VTHEVRWMFHSTAMVRDYERAVAPLWELFGLRLLEFHLSTVPEIGRRGGMTWVGDGSIEIGQPMVEGGGADRFVARTGGGMHSVALQVRDLDATIAHIEACGVKVAARPQPEMCFTDPRDTGGVFFEWAVYELDIDPHFGAPLPGPGQPVVDVTHHAFIGAVVDDPMRWGALYARLLGTDLAFEAPDAGPAAPWTAVSLGDCMLALYPRTDDDRPWGRVYERNRTHLMALRVDDLGVAAAALDDRGVAVLHRDDTLVVVDPAATGDVQVALVDRLLPGDPRPE
jgi:catechol 2,3-dioxygenase-like lactoylglutathione lyase family enzyme